MGPKRASESAVDILMAPGWQASQSLKLVQPVRRQSWRRTSLCVRLALSYPSILLAGDPSHALAVAPPSASTHQCVGVE